MRSNSLKKIFLQSLQGGWIPKKNTHIIIGTRGTIKIVKKLSSVACAFLTKNNIIFFRILLQQGIERKRSEIYIF